MCRDQMVNKGAFPSMKELAGQMQSHGTTRMGRYHQGTRRVSNDYTVTDNILGRGVSGHVREAFAVGDGAQKVAVKEISMSKLSKVGKMHLVDELDTLLCLDHPHIVRLIDVYENDDKVSLVMECIEGGLLFSRVQEKTRFNENEAADAMRQILMGVSYVHSNGIAHRDLKMENIMYDTPNGDHLKLIDFGFATFYRRRRMKSVCGTLSYAAPEVFTEDYGSQCDLWSAGVIAFIMLSGSMPFFGSKDEKLQLIRGGRYHMKPEKWDPVSPYGKDFVNSLLQTDPMARLDAKGALSHPWIVDFGQGHGSKTSCPFFSIHDTANALVSWRRTPKFLQACFTVMAWNLNKEEHAKVRDNFLLFDKDMNGSLSLDELATIMRNECDVDEAKVKKTLLQCASSIGDEQIDYSSFVAALLSKSIIEVHDRLLQTTFSKFDETNKGLLTAEDFKNAVGDRYQGASTALLSAYSEDGKAGVSYDDFLEYISTFRDSGKAKVDSPRSQNPKKKVQAVSQQTCCTLM